MNGFKLIRLFALSMLAALANLGIAGCCHLPSADASREVPLNDALHIVEDDLYATGAVSLGDLNTTVPEGKERIKTAINQAQCARKAANPLVPVFAGAFSLQLQGSITQAGQVGPTISATPSLAFQYTVTQGQQQQLTVPIAFISLAGLPNFYMGQSLANLNGLPDTDKATYIIAIEANVKALQELVNDQIEQYPENVANMKNCGVVPIPPLNPAIKANPPGA